MGLRQAIGAVFRAFNKVRRLAAPQKAQEVFSGLDLEPPVQVTLHSGNPPVERPARVIAFYLPQFHAIPENDLWWGEGFTEWTNVRAAVPQFEGHYQPHVPGELGYYNLLHPGVQARQVELAKLYGIEGFCFYFYWFAGKRLLEKPLENWLNDPSLDLPYCLCWANENWTRRWDGHDSEVLIAQQHSAEDDLAFIEAVAPYLRDPRYIRVDGKPLLIVYRPALLPSMIETADRWRKWCLKHEIGELHLASVLSFDESDPSVYGLDAAIEFPPVRPQVPRVTANIRPIVSDFAMNVFDWRQFKLRSDDYEVTRFQLYRSVCTSWDNTARRRNAGTIFSNSSPDQFRLWLSNAIRDTVKRFRDPSQRLVFVNAWNEWAEGAHLEPDQRFGYAWLQAVRDALEQVAIATERRVVLVGHDAHAHGAQYVLLYFAQTLKSLGITVDVVLLGDGVLLPRYSECARVHLVNLQRQPAGHVEALLERLVDSGVRLAIVNTTVSGTLVPALRAAGMNVLTLVHELPGLLREYRLEQAARAIAANADTVIFPASSVKIGFEDFLGQSLSQAVIKPQGRYHRGLGVDETVRRRARETVRIQHRLPLTCRIILSVGYGDSRKGLDIFVDSCIRVLTADSNAVAIWVGNTDPEIMKQCVALIAQHDLQRRFVFAGFVDKTAYYYASADVYALTSREDPFPSVVMEALEAELAVVAFKGAGGIEELLSRECGVLVPFADSGAMALAICELLANPHEARRLGSTGRRIVAEEFDFRDYVWEVLRLGGLALPKVSVVVPNFNYGRYLNERLKSVTKQTVTPYEIIILDDASTDNSLQIIEAFRSSCRIPVRIVTNQQNSGNVFRQWRKGVELAKGEFVWIAEGDDLCEPNFLAALLPAFARPEVVMSYSESRQMDESGQTICDNYLDYVADIDEWHWRHPFIADGRSEIESALHIKNTIPNVSAAVFRRQSLIETFSACGHEIERLRFAGDWVTYLRLLEDGAVSFLNEPLNAHRRHSKSVTNHGLPLLREIVTVQRDTIRRFGLGKRH